MRIEDTYNFIQEYYELCQKYRMFIVKCSCEECDELFPYPYEEDWEVDAVYNDLIDWFVMQRQESELEN